MQPHTAQPVAAALAALLAALAPCTALAAAAAACAGGGAAPEACRAPEHSLLQHRKALSLTSARDDPDAAAADEGAACHSLLEGEECYDEVLWAQVHGIFDFPQWYPAPLSPASRFEDFQAHVHSLHPDRCPQPCEVPAFQAVGERCVSRAVTLDFFHSTLAHRNLAGKGPDSGAANMRYSRVGNRTLRQGADAWSRPFDLVVTASDSYKFHKQDRSGLSGEYGIVNLKAPSSADLTFAFEDSESGEPVVLEAFHFSFFDVDESRNTEERVVVGGFESYTMDPETEVAVEERADGRMLFHSTEIGKGCDNPKDPLQLGEVNCWGEVVDQRKRAVTFLFSNRSSFNVSLEATCAARRCGGRNFLFAGSSSLATTCDEIPQPGLCAAFGDPHFVTFDGAHTVLLGHQPVWLVRSQQVWMQALSKDADGKLEGFAVGGPILRDHKLVLRKTGPWTLEASFDGAPILAQETDEFHVEGVLEGHRSPTWNATLHNDDVLAVRTQIRFSVGPWPERFLQPVGGLFLFRLPNSVEVTVTGSDVMSVVITMPPQAGGQAGYCGNFNGNATDDFERTPTPSFHRPVGEYLGAVDESEVLFDLSDWAPASGDAPELDPESVMRECSQELMAMAASRCRLVTDARMQADCVFDVCATGLISAAEGVLAAEILEEKVNARGIPLLMGEGRCLDTIGQAYAAFNTTLTVDDDCKDVLRSLALTSGVLGAQRHEHGDCVCQILVEAGADPTAVAIRGGWGPQANAGAHGHGLISNVTGEVGWTCWSVV